MSGVDTEKTNQPVKSEVNPTANNNVEARSQYRKAQEERRQKIIRPETEAATAERNLVGTKLLESVKQIPRNIPLRFHGTHAYDIEDILAAGELTSGADRVGTMTSFDAPGEISVTTPQTLETTVGDYHAALGALARGVDIRKTGYIDIIDTEVPLGGMFLLMPETAEEAAMGENEGNKMRNTSLKDKKMVGLVVSEEVKPDIETLMEKYGYDKTKCLTYKDFITKIPELADRIKMDFPFTETYTPPAPAKSFAISL